MRGAQSTESVLEGSLRFGERAVDQLLELRERLRAARCSSR